MAAAPPAVAIGHRFVRQYYSLLDKDPAKLHRLYKDQSVFSHGAEGSVTSAVGPKEINSELMSLLGPLDRHSCRSEITGVECQESSHGGVLVLVTGYMSLGVSERRHFSQALFLEKQTEPYDGYFVLNDVLRYTPSQASSPVVTPARAPAETPAAVTPAVTPAAVTAPAPAVTAPASAVTTNGDTGYNQEEEEEPEEVEAEVQEEISGKEQQAEQPKSWAAMAGTLRQGGGKLAAAKPRSGFSLPAPKAAMPVLPPPTAAAKAEAARAAAAGGQGVTGLPPPKSAAGRTATVRMWLSRLPTDQQIDNKEVLKSINSFLDSSVGQALELDHKEKDWGYLVVANQETADALVRLSKQRKLQYDGRGLKAELERKSGDEDAAQGDGAGRENRRGQKGSGKGADDSNGDGNGKGGSRKGGKGGSGKGKKGEGKKGEGYTEGAKGGGGRKGGGGKSRS
eukprot:TRINITY_DN10922_c1_g1_i4.p1 TRINITY_DN10922_c1_g1~~TRINITY_DN10922_c1_g1_i4.p1  ORF type:complete len:453 (+),score=141.77 TRINITY_DN10922_c1_g1_i4:194-1552(+)